MRLAPALLLAAVTAVLAPPPALLVLRAACSGGDVSAFERASLNISHAAVRVLGYEETCGRGWRRDVTRAALGALSGGDALALAGHPGGAACRALEEAARALARAAPRVCAAGEARAAGLARLATHLAWRRVALPAPDAARPECARALRAARRTLAAAGIATDAGDAAPPPSAWILCASRERGVSPAPAPDARLLLLHVDEPPRSPASAFSLASLVDARLPAGELLLLTADAPDAAADADGDALLARSLAEALEELGRAAGAEAAGADTFELPLRVYERARAGEWRRVATVTTVSVRPLDGAAERSTEARLANATDALERWAERGGAGAGVSGAPWPAVAAVAVAVLALCGAALVARRCPRAWDAVRGAGGARVTSGAAVLLSASEFSFPADERRRVGDGMETMVSCWLRRLHEFGGPEPAPPPARGELLGEPARAPSLPSSTCSVNRTSADRRTTYKGEPVHVKYLQPAAGGGSGEPRPRRRALDVLLVMHGLRHENLNPFIGWLAGVGALVWAHCWRGSLEDVLMADDIQLDWTFRLSLLTDLVKGMRHLHASPLRVHGRLSSRNCVVDSRWVLRLTDYGLPALARAAAGAAPLAAHRAARELLWTAPELLRDAEARARGSQPGDVFSFGIIMQEVIVRGEPYCMLALSPEDIVEKLRRPPPLIRPSVSMGAAPPEAVSAMRQCWSEAPELRPDFQRLHDVFRRLHRGRKVNIVDSMFEMLEKYSNNLEELIKERTEQLDMEKKKTEQLLNRMLPRSVAERLMAGGRVEPEEFEDVSVYFSDIVGFTALAARSSPVQVADLLNDLYTTFDAAIERYRVYKVETIGDAYMVVGGLPARARDHADSVATMALHLLHLAGAFRVRHLPDAPLRLRIGLHSGPVCAAVVGLTMPRYCLFGDTVNTASRMESTGAACRIQLSAATAARLTAAGGYRLRSRGLVQIKGKGAMHTYWLLGKDGFDKPLPTPPPLGSEEVLFEMDGENESEASSSSSAGAAPPSPRCAGADPARRAPSQRGARGAGLRRSGAVSADSSPPPAPAPGGGGARYRWLGGAGGALRRQWSLERGDTLAEAAARLPAPAAAPRPAPAPFRYRTRLEPPRPP